MTVGAGAGYVGTAPRGARPESLFLLLLVLLSVLPPPIEGAASRDLVPLLLLLLGPSVAGEDARFPVKYVRRKWNRILK